MGTTAKHAIFIKAFLEMHFKLVKCEQGCSFVSQHLGWKLTGNVIFEHLRWFSYTQDSGLLTFVKF